MQSLVSSFQLEIRILLSKQGQDYVRATKYLSMMKRLLELSDCHFGVHEMAIMVLMLNTLIVSMVCKAALWLYYEYSEYR